MLSLEPCQRANQKEGASWQELAWRGLCRKDGGKDGPSGEGAEQPSVDEAQLLPQGQEGRTLLRVAAPALQHDAVDLGRAGAGPGKAVAPGDLPYGFLVCHSCKEGENGPESDVPRGCPEGTPAWAKVSTGAAVKWCLSARRLVEQRLGEIIQPKPHSCPQLLHRLCKH